MIKDVLYNNTVFIDGRGYAGRASSSKLPKIAPVLQEFKQGGMGGTVKIPMGMLEELTCEINMKVFDLVMLSGFGVHAFSGIPVTLRGVTQDDDGTKHSVIARMRGVITEFDPGEWKAGEEVGNKLALSLRYYQLERDGRELFAFDPGAMILRVNGVDVMAEDRAILGI